MEEKEVILLHVRCPVYSVCNIFGLCSRTYGPNAATRWHKVRLRNTKDKGYVKDGLLKFFADELETQFFAINYTEEDNSILFWIQGDELAGEGKLTRWKSVRDGTFLKLPFELYQSA